MTDASGETREEAMRSARKARIESYRKDIRALLLARDLIKKDAVKVLEDQKIAHITNEINS